MVRLHPINGNFVFGFTKKGTTKSIVHVRKNMFLKFLIVKLNGCNQSWCTKSQTHNLELKRDIGHEMKIYNTISIDTDIMAWSFIVKVNIGKHTNRLPINVFTKVFNFDSW